MVVDVKFFKNLIHMLETDHNIVRNNDTITETWKDYVDRTIGQCKEMINVAKYQEEYKAVFTDYEENLSELEDVRDVRIFRETFNLTDEEQEG